jgi:hypothetical protein
MDVLRMVPKLQDCPTEAVTANVAVEGAANTFPTGIATPNNTKQQDFNIFFTKISLFRACPISPCF